MKTFSGRMIRNSFWTVIAALVVAALTNWCHGSLRSPQFFTGWVLLLIILFLASFNARKKIPFLPLGSATTWLQLHLYLGWLSIYVFYLHAGNHLPHGVLGWVLFSIYLLAAGSGVLGIFISRNFAQRLASRGEEVIYERIPELRRKLKERADKLVLTAVAETNYKTISDFYMQRLHEYFCFQSNYFWHLIGSSHRWSRLREEMDSMDRYLAGREREMFGELRKLVEFKEDLDFHQSLQGTLKYWLFIHIPLSLSLLVFVFIHVGLVYFFSGGI